MYIIIEKNCIMRAKKAEGRMQKCRNAERSGLSDARSVYVCRKTIGVYE